MHSLDMELAHSLCLNVDVLDKLPDHKKSVFMHEWLRFLEKVLSAARKADIKDKQDQILEQLLAQLTTANGFQARHTLATCITSIFLVGDTSKLFDVVNKLSDIIKTTDSSAAFISRRLAAICCLGVVCQRLGRMVGRSYDSAVVCLVKGYKTAESQTRCESLIAFGRIINGLGNVSSNIQRDILKMARAGLGDRVLTVRIAAIICLKVMAEGLPYVAPGANTELDGIIQQCSRVVMLESGTTAAGGPVASLCCGFADLQRSVADLMAYLLREAGLRNNLMLTKPVNAAKLHLLSPNEALLMLGSLFIRGTASSTASALRSAPNDFLNVSRSSSVSHELRYAVAHSYVEFIYLLGSRWLAQNLPAFLDHIFLVCSAATRTVLISNEGPHQQRVDLLVVRRSILHLLASTVGLVLSEHSQIAALLHLSNYVLRNIKGEVSTDGNNSVVGRQQSPASNNPTATPEIPSAKKHHEQEQHLVHTVVCALLHMSSLTTLVGDAIVLNPALFSLTNRQSPIIESLFASLTHSSNSVRTSACMCLRSIAIAYPPALAHLLDRCAAVLRDSHDDQLCPEVIFGFGTATATLISAAAAQDEAPRSVFSAAPPAVGGEIGSAALFGLSPISIRRMFDIGIHMLHCVPLTLRLSEARASVAYLILGAVVRHSPLAVRPLLPRLLALCMRVFPRPNPNNNEESDIQASGNAFTWQVMMEARTVVLHVLDILVTRWPYLFPSNSEVASTAIGTASTDLYLKVLSLIHRAVVFLDQLPAISRTHGTGIKMVAATFRSRLYALLHTVLQSPSNGTPSSAVSGLISSPGSLLREAVADLTLVDPVGYTAASAAPLLFASLGQHSLNLLLALGSSTSIMLDFPLALEHDTTLLISNNIDAATLVTAVWQIGQVPRSSLLVCNAARILSTVLPTLPAKHRLQIISHFGEAIRQAKSGHLRQQALQCNLLAVLLLYFRQHASTNSELPADWLNSVTSLIQEAIDSRVPLIRSAGTEALGRLAAVSDPRFAADLRQATTDRLRSSRDMTTRICQSLALGAILCQCGASQTSGGAVLSQAALQHCIGLLLGLAQDHTATSVQAAALHALAVTLDANGPLVRSYAESLVTLIVSVLLHSLGTSGSVLGSSHLPQLAARCLNAIITTLGPELAANTSVMDEARSCILTALSALMAAGKGSSKTSPEFAYAQAEALACYQQLHLYAPRHVSLLTLVPKLFDILYMTQKQTDTLDDWAAVSAVTIKSSPLVVFRRSAAGCLRQLAQREPLDLIEHTVRLSDEAGKRELEYQLFALLDVETDGQLRSDIHEALISLLQTVGTARLPVWLSLIRDVLSKTSTDTPPTGLGGQGATTTNSANSTASKSQSSSAAKKGLAGDNGDNDEDEEEEDIEEAASFGPVVAENPNPPLLPRWRSRVFAVSCLTRLIDSCKSTGDSRHFELEAARAAGGNCWLVTHLADIVRLVSLAATHPCLNVRLAGLSAMRSMICNFADSQDPELPPGSSLLEQYQAQMGASLRPAFAADAPPYITADACEVCSAWLASGITREPADLMRIHILLVGMLNRLDSHQQSNSQNQSANERQKSKTTPIGYIQAAEMFGVLRAWAEVYVEADSREQQRKMGSSFSNNTDGDDEFGESLVTLVAPNLDLLGPLWLCVLRDYALLAFIGPASSSMPGSLSHLTENLDPPDARRLCMAAFPAVVQAASLWLISVKSEEGSPTNNENSPEDGSPDTSLLLVLGSCAGTLCERLNIDPPVTLIACLRALTRLFSSSWAANRFAEDFVVVRELLQITYRLLLVRELTQKLEPFVVALATAISKSLTICHHRCYTSPPTTVPQTMTASPSLLGLSLTSLNSQAHNQQTPFSGDVVVAERVLLAIAHRVLSAAGPAGPQNPQLAQDSSVLATSVLELLGSLPSVTQCHATTTPSIFALIARAINMSSFHADFPDNIVAVLAQTVSRLVAMVAEHTAEDGSAAPLAGVMIWRLVEQILSCLSNAQMTAASRAVILIDCLLIPLSVPCPSGLSKSCYSELQFEQISKTSTNILNQCLNKSTPPADCLATLTALRRLVVGIELSASPRDTSPFAAELIAAVVSSSMHSLCSLLLDTERYQTMKSADANSILTATVSLVRVVFDFLSTSGNKNRTSLLEITLRLFARAAVVHKQSVVTKGLVTTFSDSISSFATANPAEFRAITTQSPTLRQLLHEVLSSGATAASEATSANDADRNSASKQQPASSIHLKMDFSHHLSSKKSTAVSESKKFVVDTEVIENELSETRVEPNNEVVVGANNGNDNIENGCSDGEDKVIEPPPEKAAVDEEGEYDDFIEPPPPECIDEDITTIPPSHFES